ncbi:MAG: hypothetical protein WC306_03355 [Candidatus Paceibacterota bacterium]|jgi:hypothetical protein
MKKILVILTLAVLFLVGCDSPTYPEKEKPVEILELLDSSYRISADTSDTAYGQIGVYVIFDSSPVSQRFYNKVKVVIEFSYKESISVYFPNNNDGYSTYQVLFFADKGVTASVTAALIKSVKVYGVRYE